MPLQPRVARTLYRGILFSARALDEELSRCQCLRIRELDSLQAAAASQLPRDLRGLLEIRASPSSPLSNTAHSLAQEHAVQPLKDTDALNIEAETQPHVINTLTTPTTTTSATDLEQYVRACSFRIATAAQAPDLSDLDANVGFATLRHLNSRVNALRHLVYTRESRAERFGIHVNVESKYQGADRNRYIFRYQVRISNTSEETIKLLSRAWTIRDLDGRVTFVRGPGVVGAFPTLAPKDTYEYSSAVPLQTPVGTQSGHYMFVTLTERTPDGPSEVLSRMLQVPVAPFSHRTPSMDGHPVERHASSIAASSKALGKVTRRKKKNKDEDRRR